MAELSYNNLIFSNVNKWNVDESGETSYNGILIASKLNQKNGQNYKLLDAIDIDWNRAWIRSLNTYINSTEDLVDILNELNVSNDLSGLTSDLAKVWKQIEEITLSYVTQSSLSEILNTSYQKKLVPGEYISINDETNVITTYNLASYTYLKTNYTSKDDHNALRILLETNYYTKAENLDVISKIVKQGIDEVINGADSAFDTLKEIADWILEQNRYIEVTPQEVIDSLNNPDNTYEFYYKDEHGTYQKITDPSQVITDGSVQYYKLENYFTDIKELLDDVKELQDTVGYSYLSYEYNADTGTYTYYDTYTYTGIIKDIDDLKNTDVRLELELNNTKNVANDAIRVAETARNIANTAYDKANTAYDIADRAENLAIETKQVADTAYEVAKKASEDVGTPSKIGQGYVQIKFEEIQSYEDQGYKILYYDVQSGSYKEAVKPYKESLLYVIFDESIEGTGLTKRVEEAEYTANNALYKSETALTEAKTSLYKLLVDNSNSSYIKLNLTPDQYEGISYRTIHINTTEAIFDAETGEIISHGIPSIQTVQNIYSYAVSWQILDNSL